jgi:hypothetical protein
MAAGAATLCNTTATNCLISFDWKQRNKRWKMTRLTMRFPVNLLILEPWSRWNVESPSIESALLLARWSQVDAESLKD